MVYNASMSTKRKPTSRIVLILVVIVALAVIAFIFLNTHAVKNVAPVQVPETVPTPTPAQWPSTKVSDQTEDESGSDYTIKAVYPVAIDSVITGDFKSFVDSSIAQFQSDIAGSSAEVADTGKFSLNITYTEQKNSNADNYIFSSDEYSGGAHDLVSTQTFSFSPTGQEVTLDSLFTNGAAGLNTIAPYVAAQLATTPDADSAMIAAGTAPTETNYQNFTVQSDGVTFIFDPYEVGPYSDGQQTVQVPVSVFKSIANTSIFPTQ